MVDLDHRLLNLGFCVSHYLFLVASVNTTTPGLDLSCIGHGLGLTDPDPASLVS